MPIVKTTPKEQAAGKLAELYAKAEAIFGMLPPNVLLVSSSPDLLERLLTEIAALRNHPRLSLRFFTAIRLRVAIRENYPWCIQMNSGLLARLGADDAQIESIKGDLTASGFTPAEQLLIKKAEKAIFQMNEFDEPDMEEIRAAGWTDGDMLDAADHTGFMLKMGRILTAFKVSR